MSDISNLLKSDTFRALGSIAVTGASTAMMTVGALSLAVKVTTFYAFLTALGSVGTVGGGVITYCVMNSRVYHEGNNQDIELDER
jgi:hypothetical protein